MHTRKHADKLKSARPSWSAVDMFIICLLSAYCLHDHINPPRRTVAVKEFVCYPYIYTYIHTAVVLYIFFLIIIMYRTAACWDRCWHTRYSEIPRALDSENKAASNINNNQCNVRSYTIHRIAGTMKGELRPTRTFHPTPSSSSSASSPARQRNQHNTTHHPHHHYYYTSTTSTTKVTATLNAAYSQSVCHYWLVAIQSASIWRSPGVWEHC